ncbi:hypothetical protein Tco_1503233 [Tanacetum coccineum]
MQVLEEPPETRTVEKGRQETSFEAMSHALVKDREKSKESRMRLIEQIAGGPLRLRKNTSRKAKMMEETTGSPSCGISSRGGGRKCLGFYRRALTWRSLFYPMDNRIHHIKQREGESAEAFLERFKAENMHVKGAPKCMRVSGFMHDITNSDLIKRLNDNIPKSVDEMMSVTTTFLRGELAVANQPRKKGPPSWRHHEAAHKPSFDKNPDFKNRQRSSRRHDRFTPLIKTPKDILAMDTVKFKATSPMLGPVENQNKNKFCEFHGDKGHNTNECIQLKNISKKQSNPDNYHT